MHSLRTRRPSNVANSKIQRSPSKLSKQPRNRDARQSRVDDKIKKRLSMRYADISAPQLTENIPAVPALPIGIRPQHAHSASQGSMDLAKEKQKEDARVAENKLLDEKDFDPDACEFVLFSIYWTHLKYRGGLRSDIKLKLANSTEAELMSLQSELRRSRDEVNSDLQRNVFRKQVGYPCPMLVLF
jgi:exocyst complex component 8